MKNDTIECPIIGEKIETGDCVFYSDVASGMIKEGCIPDRFREKTDWREICKKCKYHEM
jgi:hypothetical protein